MKDHYTTNSHYLTHTFLFRKVRMPFLNLGVKGLNQVHIWKQLPHLHPFSQCERFWMTGHILNKSSSNSSDISSDARPGDLSRLIHQIQQLVPFINWKGKCFVRRNERHEASGQYNWPGRTGPAEIRFSGVWSPFGSAPKWRIQVLLARRHVR